MTLTVAKFSGNVRDHNINRLSFKQVRMLIWLIKLMPDSCLVYALEL